MDRKSNRGTSMSDMYKGIGPWNNDVPPIHPSKYHSILFELPVNLSSPPKPHISSNNFHWDEGYLRMPYSDKNLFPSKDKNGKEIITSRWELIQQSLLRPIESSKDLEASIYAYNSKLPKFTALHYLFNEVFEEEEYDHFFKNLLPKIINLALQLPDILPGSVPLLKADSCKSVSLSQLQIASLLANCFLCTFPWKKDVSNTYPGGNFTSLFSASLNSEEDIYVIEKLRCIIHYFRRVLCNAPVGVVTIERQHIRRGNIPRWDKLENNLGNTRLHVSSAGTIEDDGLGLLQVDFANKFLGGGVLNYGCVQEEIRFVICPELLVSRLFVERMNNLESVIFTGVERFSKYEGYGYSFRWAGNYEDGTPFDTSGRRQTTIVAIDATYYTNTFDQFQSSQIMRELNKAYVGFHSRHNIPLPAVATGNWGCGAFRGNVHLKFLIQLMACSAAKRDMVYYTFNDEDLCEEIYNMHTFIATNQITVTQLWRILCRFVSSKLNVEKFFPFVQQAFFDSKAQPKITDFFSEPKPSTSRFPVAKEKTKDEEKLTNKHCKMDEALARNLEKAVEEHYVAISMDDVEMKEVKESPVKKKKVESNGNILDIIGKIDGESSTPKKSAEQHSFLSTIDDLTAKKMSEVHTKMEMDQVEISSKKTKITDYFKKT